MKKPDENKPYSNIPAEQAVLSAILSDDEAILQEILDYGINIDYFSESWHRDLFKSIEKIISNGGLPSFLTIVEQRKSVGNFADNEAIRISELIDENIAGVTNLQFFLKQLLEAKSRRDIRRMALLLTSDLENLDKRSEEILQTLQKEIDKHTISYQSAEVQTIEQSANNIYTEILSGKVPLGLGFSQIDYWLNGGIRGGELATIAARTSIGKTALGISIAYDLTFIRDKKVGFVSLEMDKKELFFRLMSYEYEASILQVLKEGGGDQGYSKEHLNKIKDFIDRFKTKHLYIDDSSDPDLDNLIIRMKIMKRRFEINLFIIDYIQLMVTQSDKETREREMATISRRLKLLSKELELPIICLAQLNRESEKRPDRMPSISDIRESDTIAMNSDVIILIHRPSHYGIKHYNNDPTDPTQGSAKLLLAKNRNGKTGVSKIAFVEDRGRFTDLHQDTVGKEQPYVPDTDYDGVLPF